MAIEFEVKKSKDHLKKKQRWQLKSELKCSKQKEIANDIELIKIERTKNSVHFWSDRWVLLLQLLAHVLEKGDCADLSKKGKQNILSNI